MSVEDAPEARRENYWQQFHDFRSAERRGGSRPSKTNRADPSEREQRLSDRCVLDRRLTERDGVRLREEVRDWDDLSGDRPATVRQAVFAWRNYIEEKEGTSGVFENMDTGERVRGGDPHRFHPDYCDKQYAKLKDLERGLRASYGRRFHTAMLTLTCSSTDHRGGPRPPVDHLDELLSSWEAVRRALSRELDGQRWERLAILEPHKSGYLHIHVAVFVDGVVSRSTFSPVIEAHVRNCRGAQWDAHELEDESTISVKHVGRDRDEETIGNLGTYLAEYLGTYGEDPLDLAEHVQLSNAILWATGRQKWRPSNGAQSYMSTNRREPDPFSLWEFVGIEDGEGEVHGLGEGSGGVATFVTSTDPPPWRNEWQ